MTILVFFKIVFKYRNKMRVYRQMQKVGGGKKLEMTPLRSCAAKGTRNIECCCSLFFLKRGELIMYVRGNDSIKREKLMTG
jgi:hypothetical protein